MIKSATNHNHRIQLPRGSDTLISMTTVEDGIVNLYHPHCTMNRIYATTAKHRSIAIIMYNVDAIYLACVFCHTSPAALKQLCV